MKYSPSQRVPFILWLNSDKSDFRFSACLWLYYKRYSIYHRAVMWNEIKSGAIIFVSAVGRVNRNSTFPVGSNSLLCWVVFHETKNQIVCQSCSLSAGPSVYKVIKCFLYDFISSNAFPSIVGSFVRLRCLSLLLCIKSKRLVMVRVLLFSRTWIKFVFLCRVTLKYRQLFKQATGDFKIALELRARARLERSRSLSLDRFDNENACQTSNASTSGSNGTTRYCH